MDKLKTLIKKFFTREIITYVIAGVLTTLVNLGVSYLMYNVLLINENITNAVAWVLAVIFAYFINNYWVFLMSNEGGRKEAIKFFKFMMARLFTFVLEIGIPFIFVTLLGFNFWLIKIITMVVVTILNYIFSKLLVFIKKDKKQ